MAPLPGLSPDATDPSGGLTDREIKIVEALYQLSPNGPRVVTYEDIVVQAWKLHPDDFGLRGYSKDYPDASDVHKPLYNALKSRGWVNTGPPRQKKFTLTRSGWERAHTLFAQSGRAHESSGRVRRETTEELKHLERSDAFQLYQDGQGDEILDTDFFAFYRTSVRAPAQQFEGRLAQVNSALADAEQKGTTGVKALRDVDTYLRDRFESVIHAKSQRRKKEK